MATFAHGLRGSVRLLCNTAAMSESLPQHLAGYLVGHPDIDLALQEMSSDEVLAALHRGVADLGIVADHVDTTGLVVHTWLDDELAALLPPVRKGSQSTALRFSQLLDRPFVGLSSDAGLSRFLLQQAARSGRIPRHRVRVSNFDSIACMVEAGVGVAITPRSATNRWRTARVQIVPLQDTWAQRKLLICLTPQAGARPAVQSLVKALLAA
jgi:DNA-binding transcriptional LysR family regulator